MTDKNTLEFTDANFDEEVLQSKQPVLVDIWATWCQPCRAIAPTISELAQDYAGRVKVGKLDADANQQTTQQLGVSSIPTILLYKDGQVIQKFVGVTPKQTLAAELDKAAA